MCNGLPWRWKRFRLLSTAQADLNTGRAEELLRFCCGVMFAGIHVALLAVFLFRIPHGDQILEELSVNMS